MFPQTPALFLYRSPLETVASMMNARPAWYDLIAAPRSLQACFFPTLREVPAGETIDAAALFAHAWRSNVDAAFSLPAERVYFVEYAALIGDPLGELASLLGFLRQAVTGESLALMAAQARIYSKDAARANPFDPAGAHRRAPLNAGDAATVRAIASDAFERLEERRRQARSLPVSAHVLRAPPH
jgi:hypothetical protein